MNLKAHILVWILFVSTGINFAQSGGLLVIAPENHRVYLNNEFIGFTKKEFQGIYLENLIPGKYELMLKGPRVESGVFRDSLDIIGGKTVEIEIASNLINKPRRYKGFRTDGYYIFLNPVKFKFLKRSQFLLGLKYNSAPYAVWMAFSFSNVRDSTNQFVEIQTSMNYENYSEIEKIRKKQNYSWKKFHEEFFPPDKIMSGLKRNEELKNDKELRMVSIYHEEFDMPVIYWDSRGLYPWVIGNFMGLDTNYPKVDLIVLKNTYAGGPNSWRKFKWGPLFDNRSDNESVYAAYSGIELMFVPYTLSNN